MSKWNVTIGDGVKSRAFGIEHGGFESLVISIILSPYCFNKESNAQIHKITAGSYSFLSVSLVGIVHGAVYGADLCRICSDSGNCIQLRDNPNGELANLIENANFILAK
ncbi:MAG: hypothetical protein WD491_07225 [Balneolales bacterium]